eukprot:scaffold19439_cov136-Isochrysis_galbana.AAC.3
MGRERGRAGYTARARPRAPSTHLDQASGPAASLRAALPDHACTAICSPESRTYCMNAHTPPSYNPGSSSTHPQMPMPRSCRRHPHSCYRALEPAEMMMGLRVWASRRPARCLLPMCRTTAPRSSRLGVWLYTSGSGKPLGGPEGRSDAVLSPSIAAARPPTA